MSDNTSNKELISEGKLKQLKEDQIKMVDAYVLFAKENLTILPFLKILNKKVLAAIKEIENNQDKK